MRRGAGRGWGAVLGLALAVMALSVIHPVLLIAVPLALLFIGMPPRRLPLVLAAGVLMTGAFLGPPADPLWYAERGWGLVLGAWFLVSVVAWPGAHFFSRALASVAATALTAALTFVAAPGAAWDRVDWAIVQRLRDAAGEMAALWGLAGASGESLAGAIYQVAEVQALVYPSFLALASLAGLGVAWWAHRRIAAREPRPLGSFREFRFGDGLVWLLIAGILLVVLPLGGAALRTGWNVLVFMGVLYALRGAAVVLALMGGMGLGGVIVAAVAVLLLYPLVMIATVLVGLSDTWLDLRARLRSAVGPPS